MKEFKENFPSLVGKEVDMIVTEVRYPNDGRRIAELKTNSKRFCESYYILGLSPIVFIGKNDVENNLLDKSVVSGVIDSRQPKKIIGVYKGSYAEARLSFEYWLALEELKKELGLK